MITEIVRSQEELSALIDRVGILPFFNNSVPGWSLEEHTHPALWFTDEPGPWEWKGPLASERRCVYGKFIHGRAAFVSPAWFTDLANWRRDGYDWEGWESDGLANYKDRLLMDYLASRPYVLSKAAKRECGFAKGYDTVLTRLQMQTFVLLADFQYSVSREGAPYGWGNAVLDTPERWLGETTLDAGGRTPQQSFERMIAHLRGVLPEADENALRRELR